MADLEPPPTPASPSFPRRALSEVGLVTVFHSPRDIKLLCLQRFIRLFAYGSSILTLVPLLEFLGHSRSQSGLFMTLTLIGDVLVSFLLTLFADSAGRKFVLAWGAALMAFSGLVFAWASNYWVLLAAAVLGVISPSGNEIGPFKAVEDSVVANLIAQRQRGDVYAWYSIAGKSGKALGITKQKPSKRNWRLLPKVSPESKSITATLCLIFAFDSLASGITPLSWVTVYFRSRFNMEEGKLGSIFFATSIISAVSVLVASSLAKRLGNVKTMVFTHLPSAIFLSLIPLPSSLPLSLVFLVLRSCTQSMVVAPRSAFLAAILLPNERTAVMGTVNVVKTAAQSMGPLITGVLANHGLFWMSFLLRDREEAKKDEEAS
ncbi:major facilitator superfamily domain-containing protein [Hirsutella rhossiliensis]|uniref:Major facilitator superfamily domain-containing protein n=1 Tax=Hirsutella rhossiliensis TaxID=111463 RepID=A0A9P8N6C3_9HYPO|nr:major facilitator superfamily domain-containing protein [Hirsutella rhossiliensis]KAH0966599.1 major facilitator superfamily domain-containing protein [Hirsutella rhossiliensis]